MGLFLIISGKFSYGNFWEVDGNFISQWKIWNKWRSSVTKEQKIEVIINKINNYDNDIKLLSKVITCRWEISLKILLKTGDIKQKRH